MPCDRSDPYDEFDLECPTLAEQIEPYRPYGDTELALSLLAFQKRYGVSVPILDDGRETGTFAARCRPADVGADYVCEYCDEPVRGVSRSPETLLACPLCGETPGMLTLGQGVDSE